MNTLDLQNAHSSWLYGVIIFCF